MRKLNYYGIALLPLMLASCGGNFGVQPVVESTPTAYPVTFKSKDVPTLPPPAEPSVETTPVNRPAVGAAMRLLRRNIPIANKQKKSCRLKKVMFCFYTVQKEINFNNLKAKFINVIPM